MTDILELYTAEFRHLTLYAFQEPGGWSAAVIDQKAKTTYSINRELPRYQDESQDREFAKREAKVMAASRLEMDVDDLSVEWIKGGQLPEIIIEIIARG